jgi:PAS domain S-box-containing protein
MNRKVTISLLLSLAIVILHFLAGLTFIFLSHRQLRRQAMAEAEAKAAIILDHNLAIHTYFSHQLKPKLFKLMDASPSAVSEAYFEPAWMSSTYAVREIYKYFKSLTDQPYYYKESALNARHPENEADAYERRFLQRLNRDETREKQSTVRTIGGDPYFTLIRRGEKMEAACLRCHDTPQRAPGDLVKIYGPDRSFGRRVGDTVSAISLRIPMETALSGANRFSARLAGLLFLALAILTGVQLLLFRYILFLPLSRIQKEIARIADSDDHLGKEIRLPFGRELREMSRTFNRRSGNLLKSKKAIADHQARLESLVRERTETLRKSEERYRIVSEMVSDYAYSLRVEPDGTFYGEWVTDAFERITGYRREAVRKGADLTRLYHPDDLPVIQRHVGKALAGETDVAEFRFIIKDGRTRWVRSYSRPVRDPEAGRVVRIYGAVRDITARKGAELQLQEYIDHLEEIVEERTSELRRTQEELLRKQRLAVLGHFAGSISHELRNPLAAVDSSAYILRLKHEDCDDSVRIHLDRISDNIRKSTAIIESLLKLSRMEPPKTERIDLADWLIETLSDAAIPDSVEVALDLPDEKVFVDIDAEQMRMALKNVVKNAVQAMDGSGRLTIATRQPTAGDIGISVTDTGPGITPENLEKVFEPLFSTKTHGIGFGLSITKMIVENHGGTIRAESPPDGGVRFVMTFPQNRPARF